MLDRLRRAESLPKDLVSDLKEKGKLPASDGKIYLWSEIRRNLDGGVPAVPGIQEPKILNEALSQDPILTISQLKLAAFNIDELLRNKNFAPVTPITTTTSVRRNRYRHSLPRRSATDERRNSLEEQEHIRALKEEHYAWHCQACLGSHDVLKVAPPGTYIYSPGYRKRLIEAHHVQHLQNTGDLGARNLLILCNFHHDLLGDDLSRDSVSAALLVAESISRAFPKDRSGKDVERRKGLLASVTLTTEPFVAKLFFTPEHAAAWKVK